MPQDQSGPSVNKVVAQHHEPVLEVDARLVSECCCGLAIVAYQRLNLAALG